MIKVDYRDEQGIRRRAEIPYEGVNPVEGIPVSLPLEQLFGHMPLDFQVQLSDALFNRGLVEASDFFKAGAAELARNAILDVAKHDALDLISLAKQLL